MQARLQSLQAAEAWHAAPAPPNVRSIASAAEFKAAVLAAPPGALVVADFFKPSCVGCRALYPKLLKIAASSPEVLFLKVNAAEPGAAGLAAALGADALPWFAFLRGGPAATGEPLAAFSANLRTVDTLRAEIAAHKACRAEEGCDESR
jgi:thioredoxin-like negative regulator of GroEL